MAGTIQIYNMALGQIGSTSLVMDLNERSMSLQTCNLYWEQARDAALADYPWPFATKQAYLALDTVTPVNWLYQYLLPADHLRSQKIIIPDWPVSSGFAQQLGMNPPYEQAWGQGGTVLKTNTENCLLQYTAKVTDDVLYPPEFVGMVALKLAASIAVPLKASATRAAELIQLYTQIKQTAEATSLNQAQPFPNNMFWQSEFISR